MSKADSDFLLYWTPTLVACLILMAWTLFLGRNLPKDKDGKGKKPAA
jgi:hypothetical protein